MEIIKTPKPAGRHPKAPEDKVESKGVYLTGAEWALIEKTWGSGTQAMRETALKVAKGEAVIGGMPSPEIQDLNKQSTGTVKNLNEKKKTNYKVNTTTLDSRRKLKQGIK